MAKLLGIVDGHVVVEAAAANVPVVGLGTQLLVPDVATTVAPLLEPEATEVVNGFTLFPPLALAKLQLKAAASLWPCWLMDAEVSSLFKGPPED